jgi:hypothetical protein
VIPQWRLNGGVLLIIANRVRDLSPVRTGLFVVKLTETVVNLTKLSPMRTAGSGKVTKLSSIDHQLLVLP